MSDIPKVDIMGKKIEEHDIVTVFGNTGTHFTGEIKNADGKLVIQVFPGSYIKNIGNLRTMKDDKNG